MASGLANNIEGDVYLNGTIATGTGTLVRATSPTLVTPALGTPTALVLTNATGDRTGTTTNDSAAAGKVGQLIESEILVGSAVSLTSGNAADVTSISLTAGDWDVEGLVAFSPNAATTSTFFQGWISSTSATPPTAPNAGAYFFTQSSFSAGLSQTTSLTRKRFSLAGTTTVYLSARSTFAVNTMAAYGYIIARRVR